MNYLKQEFYQILKSDENFFDFIQMNAFDGIWFWNLENSTDKWINPKFCNLLGYKYEELQGNQIQKIVHKKDQLKMQNVFDNYVKNTQSVYEDEVRFINKQGKIVCLKLKALVFDNKESKQPRVLVTHTNMTKQYNQKKELESTLAKYESLLNNTSIFIIRTDLEGNYSYVNDSFCERLNLDREEIMGKSSLSAIVEEDHQKCIDTVYKCFANPEESFFVQIKKPIFDIKTNQFSDVFIYTDWEYKAILDEQKNITEIQCIGMEITDKVLSQNALQKKADALEASEEELRLNIEQLKETQQEVIHLKNLLQTCNEAVITGIWQVNLITGKIEWDKVTKQIHEVEQDYELKMVNKLQFCTPNYIKVVEESSQKAVQEGIRFDVEIQIKTAKGNKKWVRAIGIPVMENQKCIELYGTFQDITIQKEAELEIKEKVHQLEIAQNQLLHTQKLLDATNEAAQIGTWEINLTDFAAKWDKITKQIHEVESDFVCNVEIGINFYKEGYSRQIIGRAVKKAIEEGISYDEQLKIITAKGKEIWVRTIGIPVFENGKCIEMYGTFQNIDKQKTNEINLQQKLAELEVSQKQLLSTSKLLESCNASASIGTWEYNVNTREIIWDSIVNNVYQLPENIELDTQTKINFFKKGENREKAIQIIKEAREEGKSFDEELELINFRGNNKWVRIIGIPQMKNERCVELYGTFQDITPQKEAQLQLKEKVNELETAKQETQAIQNKLSRTLEKTGIGLWEIDIQANKVYWDNQIRKMLGAEDLPEGALDRTNKFNYINEEDAKRVNKLLADFISGKITNYHIVYQTMPIHGKTRFHESKAILIKDKNEIPISILGITQDITAQKEADFQIEQKVKELETVQQKLEYTGKLLETCNEKAIIGIWEFDLKTGVNKIDKIIRQIHEVDENYVSSVQKGQDRYVGEHKEIITNAFNAALSAGVPFDKQLKMITDKGNKKWVRIIGIPTTENGKVVQLYGFIQDITKQKQDELQLKEKVNELKNTKQEIQSIQNKLSTTLDKTGIGTWEYDVATNKIYWDSQVRKMFGVTEFEEITQEVASSKIPKQNLLVLNQMFEDLIMQKTSSYHAKYPVNLTKDSIKYYDSKAVLIKDENNKSISVFGVTQDITQQTEAELQLEQKVNELENAQKQIQNIQNRLTLALEKTGIGIWELDLINNQNHWDKQTRKMFGVTEFEELNPENTAQKIHADDFDYVNQMVEDLIAQKIPQYHSVYRTIPINGKIHYHEGKATLIKDEKGKPISVLGITQDITTQKEYEQIIEEQNKELAASERELRKGIREMYYLQQDLANQKHQLEQIFDAVPAMIYQFKRDKEGNVSFPLVSKGAESILGTTAEQILDNSSTDIFEAIHPEDLLGFQSSVAKSAQTMQKWESELRLLKNGKEVWIHASSKPSPTEDGGIVWTGIMQNIDNLKATELKAQQQNKQLQETLNELRETQSQLIHNEKMTTLGQLVASIAHEINTPLGAIHSSSGIIFKMLKSTLSNLPKIINILSEKHLETFNTLIEKSIEANDVFSSKEKRTIKYQLITDLENRNINQAARIADILVDSGLHLEATLYESFLEVPQSIQIFDSIYEISSILKSNATVQIATQKASKIITTLKDFSRQDHTGEKKPTSINESLQNTLVLYQNQLKYGIEVIREMDNLPLINVYEDELVQVWTNLLHNSIQAIEKKGKIYLTTKKTENKILVSIRDTGKGISEEIRSKVFDAFFTTKTAGEGSGLGLNIVRKIVEKHEGKIWFETENIGENTGTTFFVELPIQ